MTIDELKTTEEVRNYCEKVGYENLTDDDVKNLCLKLYNIADAEEEKINKMEYVSGVKIAMIMGMRSSIASQCDFIRNCTPARREKNTMELLDHFDRVAPGIIDEYAGMTESEIEMERRIHR